MCIRGRRSVYIALASLMLTLGWWTLLGQTSTRRILGPHDSDVPIPEPPVSLIRQDPTALVELALHVKGLGSVPWVGFKGVGIISPVAVGSNPEPIVLYLYGKDSFRLDATTPNGILSIRMHDSIGQILPPDSRPVYLAAATAAVGSIQLQFPRLQGFPGTSSSFIDKGQVTVDGQILHRIAAAVPIREGVKSTHPNLPVPIDFYFDALTHLLIKSATVVQLPSSGRESVLEITTYSNYQSVNGSLLPFTYEKTINGQLVWTITLTQAELLPQPPRSFFDF